jgi:hypothetical protein
MVPHHVFDAKVFQGQSVVPRNQTMRDFVQKILTTVLDPLVMPLQLQNRLAPVPAALLFAGDGTLNAAKVFLTRPIPARVFYELSVAGRQQVRDANVYADDFTRSRQDFGLTLAGKASIPFPCPAGDANGLDCSDNLSVPTHGDTPDAADFEPPSVYLKSVRILFQAERVELVLAFVSRIPRRLPALDAAKKVLERFVQVGGDYLQNVTVYARHFGLYSFEFLDAAKLLCLSDGMTVLVSDFSLVQQSVVECAAHAQRSRQVFGLRFSRVQPKAIAKHRLHSLLRGDVPLNGFSGHVSRTCGEERASPEGRQSQQFGITLTQDARCVAFDLARGFRNRVVGVHLDKQMNMVGHNRQFVNNPLLFGALLTNKRVQVSANVPDQNFLAPLGTKNQVVHDQVNSVFIVLITRVCHVDSIPHFNTFVNTYFCLTITELTSFGLKPLFRKALRSPPNAPLKQGCLRRAKYGQSE